MADAYVYYFTILNQRTGESVITQCRATLEAIRRNKGEPVLESLLEVDLAEIDDSGFLVRSVGGSHPADEFWGEIRSLNLRAASRDQEALNLDANTEGLRKQMLYLESRELRKKAQCLQKRRSDILAAELGNSGQIEQFGVSPTPE